MKRIPIYLTILLACLFLGSSCSKDDDDGCTPQTWVGTYTGTLSIPNLGTQQVTFEIGLGTLGNSIRFNETGVKANLPNSDFEVDGCAIVNKQYNINWLGGPVQTIWSGSLSGNNLSIDVDVNLLGLCEIRGVR